MPAFHTRQQPLCHLRPTRMKEKLLEKNVLLPHTDTKKLVVYTFISR